MQILPWATYPIILDDQVSNTGALILSLQHDSGRVL